MKFDIVVKDMDGITREAVNGRQLHEVMGVKTPYHMWIKRQIKAYGLRKSLDFEVLNKNVHKLICCCCLSGLYTLIKTIGLAV